MKKKELENRFENYQGLNEELKQVELHNGDARLGRVVALVKRGEHGTISPVTSYMKYSEMNAWLDGYLHAKNAFNFETLKINI